MEYICQVCKKRFIDIPAKKRKYCSHKCFYKASEKREEIICLTCDRRVIRRKGEIVRKDKSFCSPHCYWMWQRLGQGKFKELRNKGWCEEQYKTKSLKKIADFLGCGETVVYKFFKRHRIKLDRKKWLQGIPKTKEHRHNLSINRINSGISKGIKNNNWKGGITKLCNLIRSSKRYLQWRKEVFATLPKYCVFCRTNKRLEVDHIKKFKYILVDNKIENIEDAMNCIELWDTNNGRILCRSCNISRETI